MNRQGRQDPSDNVQKQEKIVVALLWKSDAGTATSINDLAVALDRDRFEVIFVFLGSQGAASSRLGERNPVFYLPEGWTAATRFLPTLIRLTRILRTHHVDVLHCHNPKASLYGTLAGALVKRPATLVQFHGLRRTRGLRRKIENLMVFGRAQRIIGVAEAVRQDIIDSNWHVPRERLAVLENSVDYDRFSQSRVSAAEAREMLGMPRDAIVFGTIGRLVPTKGLPYLMQAFGRVKQQIPLAQMVLLGDGKDRGKLERQVTGTPYRDAIHFLGYRPNIEDLLQGMDVFVLSSVAEGMPRVVLEAMAAGVPCVCTAVGGIPEMLDHGRLGLLAPPRDAEGLARAMVEIVTWPQPRRRSLIEEARRHVQTQYSHDVIQAKLAELYEQAFAASQTGRSRK